MVIIRLLTMLKYQICLEVTAASRFPVKLFLSFGNLLFWHNQQNLKAQKLCKYGLSAHNKSTVELWNLQMSLRAAVQVEAVRSCRQESDTWLGEVENTCTEVQVLKRAKGCRWEPTSQTGAGIKRLVPDRWQGRGNKLASRVLGARPHHTGLTTN